MSTIAPPMRGKVWVWQITALCFILGALLALSLKTQRLAIRAGEPTRSFALGDAYRSVQQQNVKLQKELADSKTRVERLVKEDAGGRYGTRTFQKVFDETKLVAGVVAVHGPGIVVVLQDSPKPVPSGLSEEMMNQYIVHDRDVREVTNELFSAGAEAISVNGQRLVATSSVRCAGSVVLVNTTQVGAPFFIKAIGKPDLLEGALRMTGGVAEQMALLDMIQITRQPDILIPAYTGSTRFSFARPVPEKN